MPGHRGLLAFTVDDDVDGDPAWWRGACMCGWRCGDRRPSREMAEEDMLNHLASIDWAPYMIDVELPPFNG